MPNKDPLGFNKTPVKKGVNWLLVGLITASLIAVTEFAVIINLTVLKRENLENTTEAYTVEEIPVTEEVTTEEITTEELATADAEEEITEEITEEVVTEEVTETEIPADDFTTREYYYLFSDFFGTYNTHQLRAAVDTSYLPQLRDVIFTQILQTAGTEDEEGYWGAVNGTCGGTAGVGFEITAENVLDEATVSSLAEQLSGYGFTDAIEQAVSVSVTETYFATEDNVPKTASYNTYVLIKTGGVWWITGRQAQ
jgi:hypothetical protein